MNRVPSQFSILRSEVEAELTDEKTVEQAIVLRQLGDLLTQRVVHLKSKIYVADSPETSTSEAATTEVATTATNQREVNGNGKDQEKNVEELSEEELLEIQSLYEQALKFYRLADEIAPDEEFEDEIEQGRELYLAGLEQFENDLELREQLKEEVENEKKRAFSAILELSPDHVGQRDRDAIDIGTETEPDDWSDPGGKRARLHDAADDDVFH